MFTEDKQALAREVVPRTLRSLFVLRIALCVAAAALAVAKISLSPPSAEFWLDLITDTPNDHEVMAGWLHAADILVSGLLASVLALVVATLFIQARVLGYVSRETADEGGVA